jgi:hypothetical protein
MQHRQRLGDVDAGGHHVLLRGSPRHERGRARRGERAGDAFAQCAVVEAERRLARLLRAQQIPDHRHGVGFDRGKEQRPLAVELFHDARGLEMRVDGIAVGEQLARVRDPLKGGAKPRVEGVGPCHGSVSLVMLGGGTL